MDHHHPPLRRRFRPIINVSITLVMLFLFFTSNFIYKDLLFNSNLQNNKHQVNLQNKKHQYNNKRSILELQINTSTSPTPSLDCNSVNSDGIQQHIGFSNQCDYLREVPLTCMEVGGVVDYVRLYYCGFDEWRVIGFVVMTVWLVALFYVLGNTAADYFCCSLEKLSGLLKLPPTVAGVTLLPLGNGAPDVFASVAAFVGSSGRGEVGLNSVLGGAVFVTCVVVGIVAISVSDKEVRIDGKCFVRDIGFFLFTLVALSVILIVGEVSIWGAVAFVGIYVVYAFSVAANEILRKHARRLKLDIVTPLLPVRGSIFSNGSEEEGDESVYSSLLDVDPNDVPPTLHSSLPQWMWASNVAIYSNAGVSSNEESQKPLWGWVEEDTLQGSRGHYSFSFSFAKLVSLMELPLSLPRKLTIPIVEEERWSKMYAVLSASLSPILFASLLNTSDSENESFPIIVSVIVGATLGSLSYYFLRSDQPPRRYLLPWVLGGFLMSIVWFYIVANELVALLVAFGVILEINPSILGLTILAWGNSMGDLMSNVALAINSGDGVQIAMSGCYAGPMFNTLAGLGVSMLIGAWSGRPALYSVPQDSSLFYTMGFLMSGLIWALVVLPQNDMQPNKMLGVGLISLYLIFLLVRLSSATGIISLSGLS